MLPLDSEAANRAHRRPHHKGKDHEMPDRGGIRRLDGDIDSGDRSDPDHAACGVGPVAPALCHRPRGDYNRLFIVEQRSGTTGRIRILNLPATRSTRRPISRSAPWRRTASRACSGWPSIPNFLTNGYFFVYYTNSSGNNMIVGIRPTHPLPPRQRPTPRARPRCSPFSHPTNTNHNGGWIGFRRTTRRDTCTLPQATAAAATTRPANAQNVNVLLGKDAPDRCRWRGQTFPATMMTNGVIVRRSRRSRTLPRTPSRA